MRCFLSIDLSKEVKKELGRIEEELKQLKEIAHLRFVEPKNLHLTLKFFGEVTDSQVNDIKEALKDIKLEPFKVKLNSVGVFTPSYIKVIWIDIFPDVAVKDLHHKIDENLNKKGFRKDKGFEAHVTLARVKSVRDKKEFLSKIKSIKPKSIEFNINSFSLKKSTLTEDGPIYENIIKF